MNKNEQTYYSIANILSQRCEYNILLGERSNGKSYSVKEHVLLNAYKSNSQFGYIRRWREEIKAVKIEKYFADMPISEYTNGEYDGVMVYRSEIYFSITIDGKKIKGKKIGDIFCLTGVTHYKSEAFPDIEDLILEEFITDKGYLPHEVDSLQDLVSTIARRRKIRVWLIGNTISRICPYFAEWQLKNIKNQKQGTIEIYLQKTSQIDDEGNPVIIKVGVEYCSNTGNNSKMFFGIKSKMVTSGTWQCEEVEHLQGNISDYLLLYKLLYEYNDFSFVINLLKFRTNNQIFLYVYPYTGNKDIKRKVTNKFSYDKYTTQFLSNLTKFDKYVIMLLSQSKIVYSDNLTGTEFQQIKRERGCY